jgi:hypothetical protein
MAALIIAEYCAIVSVPAVVNSSAKAFCQEPASSVNPSNQDCSVPVMVP